MYIPVFPGHLETLANQLLHELQPGHHAVHESSTVIVEGRQLCLPGRVYWSVKALGNVISGSQGDMRLLGLCFGSRHADGHVREWCARELVQADRPWVVPFVVQLVGEYVMEIAQLVCTRLQTVDASAYARFVRENAGYMATTRRRATSYWDCYYRDRFPELRNYPGIVALDAIERMV